MSIGTPVVAATNSALNASTLQTSADIPIGSAVFVFLSTSDPGYTVSGVSDGTANVYVPAAATANNAALFETAIYCCLHTVADIPSGTTFTGTSNDPYWTIISGICYVSGANGGIGNTASVLETSQVGTFSVATGVLSAPNQLILGAWTAAGPSAVSSYTEAAGFTSLFSNVNDWVFVAYKIVSAETSVTYAPTAISPTQLLSGLVASFQATDTDILYPQACL